ncbi:inorganic phosphate transporter [Paracoccus sp. JM45]|uniref:inorganic phosphate transporter n=1 Tax=Paracoccus sp. JM45 TaxID=2283626 RepID=UPI000E6C57BF|nr:inorganic phosphate transporter [Paracoccus sp. JM45]RJE79412.1 anion permease [Paracoccus sp. JM45]
MSNSPAYRTLDKDLGRIGHAEVAQMHAFRPVWRLGMTVLALVGALLVFLALSGAAPGVLAMGAGLIVAAWLGVAIGSNDVANSLGPAVGAGAISLLPGLFLVAGSGMLGAFLAGGAVSERLAGGIIDLAPMMDGIRGPMVMVAALIGAASWITMATGIGLPVSTSHSIVGGIAGAGAVALGVSGVAWGTVLMIALVWVITPLAAGALAGLLLIFLRAYVVDAEDRGAAALRWLPVMVGVMCAVFASYLTVLLFDGPQLYLMQPLAIILGVSTGYGMTLRGVLRELKLHPKKPGTKRLLRPALLIAVVIMGFAHGANDVGNIAGPLSVILKGQILDGEIGIVPPVILIGGGLSIAIGTLFFGRRLVNMVGSGITRLNAGRAFCVSMATAVTVLTASGMGLPVSTTHVAVGGIFGVGFAREFLDRRRDTNHDAMPAEETRRRMLVRRSHVVTITAAWLVTLPITAGLGAAACALVLWTTGV